ncbi:Hypothetical_protein [Hexamita inflata]|uniref:Hypothetical_protein n=1 Tax=Hexamita inflata TaxID=28002 RepID=A0AA86NXY8_9EUKA|nr:Hypothetical protein HINF_LOCUS14812 [Hexamita inflata]
MLTLFAFTLQRKKGFKKWDPDTDMSMNQELSTFTRKIGTCQHDDIYPAGPKGVSIVLVNYNDVFSFNENGFQRYTVKDVEFDDKNTNKSEGEPKYYEFEPGNKWESYKHEIFTYRSEIVPNPISIEDFEQMFRTIVYGIKWETWSDQVQIVRDAIERETGGSRIPQLNGLRKILYEWVDGMNGKFELDMHEYGDEDDEDDDEDDDA